MSGDKDVLDVVPLGGQDRSRISELLDLPQEVKGRQRQAKAGELRGDVGAAVARASYVLQVVDRQASLYQHRRVVVGRGGARGSGGVETSPELGEVGSTIAEQHVGIAGWGGVRGTGLTKSLGETMSGSRMTAKLSPVPARSSVAQRSLIVASRHESSCRGRSEAEARRARGRCSAGRTSSSAASV